MTDKYAAKKQLVAERRRQGLCRDCYEPAVVDKSMCRRHLDALAARMKKWRGEKGNRRRRMVVARCACGLGITQAGASQCGFCAEGLTA